MAKPYGAQRVLAFRSGADSGDNAELLEEPQVVQLTPALSDATVSHAEDVDARKRDLAPGGRDPHDLPMVGASSGEALGDEIRFGDELMEFATPLRKGGSEAGSRRSHPFPVGANPHGWVVVHEVFTQVGVDGFELATTEQPVDEFSNDLLVCIDVCHALTVDRLSPKVYPGFPGFFYAGVRIGATFKVVADTGSALTGRGTVVIADTTALCLRPPSAVGEPRGAPRGSGAMTGKEL
jgi:hypothetical protein